MNHSINYTWFFKFKTNGCVANAFYGWDLDRDGGIGFVTNYPKIIYMPGEIQTYWYNGDCYAKHFAMCQRKAAEYGPDDYILHPKFFLNQQG